MGILSVEPQDRVLRSFLLIMIMMQQGCEAPSPPSSAFASLDRSGGQDNQPDLMEIDLDNLVYLPTLDGQWAHYSQISTCVDIGSSLEQINRSIYRVSLRQTPHGGIVEEWEACEIDLTPVISVKARVPEMLRSRVYPLETRLGQVVGAPPEQYYASGPVIELWGIQFDDALVDEMPQEAMDERIFDMDEDDQPGVTLQIGDACEAYMAQRRISRYQGKLLAPDIMSGEAFSVTEQLILDASSPICKTSYQTRSNPERSQFVRVRIDGKSGGLNLDLNEDGEVSCMELSQGRELLFDRAFELQEVEDESCRL